MKVNNDRRIKFNKRKDAVCLGVDQECNWKPTIIFIKTKNNEKRASF